MSIRSRSSSPPSHFKHPAKTQTSTMCFLLVNTDHSSLHRLVGIPERRWAEHSPCFHRCRSKYLHDTQNCSITSGQPYFNAQHTAVMNFPPSRPCDYELLAPTWYRENPRRCDFMSQDHSPQQGIFSETQGNPYGTWCMHVVHPSWSYPMIQATPNVFLSMYRGSQVGSPTDIDFSYPSAMNSFTVSSTRQLLSSTHS
ncbi:hypothetical protein IW261DRAFT_391608 [Armillaria novae-zelandiae]|uniref:Uncharacterized protein n=1 Tax=Armillaria novae-zelandiae TaxID=153914 RepID=A0AA39PSY8_9AGAR|nr:hypothetical protein IW261DRAFT_391608 [Armillaria novae-zelandiae]